MLRFWPSRPDGLDTDSLNWPGRKERARTGEMIWRFLDRSYNSRATLSMVFAGFTAAFVSGAWTDPSDQDDALVVAWLVGAILWMVLLSYTVRIRVIRLAALAEQRGATIPESIDIGDDVEAPLPPGVHLLDDRRGTDIEVLILASLWMGGLAAALMPGGGEVNAIVIDALVIAAGLFFLGLGIGLAVGRVRINDSLVGDAFSSRGQAAFYRTTVPFFLAIAVGAGVYVAARRGALSDEDAADVLVGVLLCFGLPSASLFLIGRPALLIPYFMRALGAPRTIWDAIPEAPYERKDRKRRFKSRRPTRQ